MIHGLLFHAFGINRAVFLTNLNRTDTVKLHVALHVAFHAVHPVDEAQVVDRCRQLQVLNRFPCKTEVDSRANAGRLNQLADRYSAEI